MRGLIVGSAAFVLAVLAERAAEPLLRDLRRYDRLSAMSDDPPLVRKIAGEAIGRLSELGLTKAGGARNVMESLLGDAARYARIRSM